MNHRGIFSSVDVNRKFLPGNYKYNNWNMAAVKSAVKLADDSLLVFGNIGIWKTDSSFTSFRDFNQGFPDGIDNRKIYSLIYTDNHRLIAGTLFGLFEYDNGWKKISIPVKEERIVKIIEKNDSLLVMTRSYLLLANLKDKNLNFSKIPVFAGEDSDNKVGLFRTIWVIHSGEIYGIAGKLLVDLVGLIFIFITLSGIFYWLAPRLLKRVKESSKSRIKQVNRFSLKWHNKLGYWSVLFLLLTSITGMFLRPPLLILIANTEVTKIKYSKLDDPNTWDDKFRDLMYDEVLKRYIVATSDGIYYSDDEFGSVLRKYPVQPPVSIMGINVFETMATGGYLVGSFSGIYQWIPDEGIIIDHFTKLRLNESSQNGSPFGAISVSGFIGMPDGNQFVFDYAAGAIRLGKSGIFPPMPAEVIKKSPFSLWNTSQEIHTGRIWEFLLGPFYILIVPLTGLASVLILVTGFFAWWIPYRRKTRNKKVAIKGPSQHDLT
jgi:membrane protein implicated in regulation of membrane protease activity